jgi:RecB family exonuclease
MATVTARSSTAFTAWDGHVGPRPELALGHHPLSPTSLEAWATCPFRYFLAKVLGLAAVEAPEELDTISAADRGSLVHLVLERLVREGLAPAGADEPWSDAAHRRAEELVAEVGERLRRDGRTGLDLPWRVERRRVLDEVLRTLHQDDHRRRDAGVATSGVEVLFGYGDSPPAELRLDDGRVVRFRGFVDRVDASADGARVVVTDYKTSKATRQEDVDRGIARGTLLQLPVYALAAGDRHPGAEVEAAYWYVSERGGWRQASWALDDEHLGEVRGVVAVIADGIEGGRFPARPGDEDYFGYKNCKYCDFHRLCAAERQRVWFRKRDAPELAGYAALSEPERLERESAEEAS